MCSGPDGVDYAEQGRLASLASIKAKHKSKISKKNIILGGGTKEYRRSTATGAKTVGQSSKDIANKRMSDIFSKTTGGAEISAKAKAKRQGLKDWWDMMIGGRNGGFLHTPGGGGSGASSGGGMGIGGTGGAAVGEGLGADW